MSVIDRKRIAAARMIETLGYTFDGVQWNAPSDTAAASPDN
jgi:hypothetical protein